jgi:hypothetical protein
MITEDELAKDLIPEDLAKKIVHESVEFVGQIDDLYHAVGMIIIGRLYGWEVMRIAAPRRIWTVATEHFGDPKELMPRRGELSHKSIGLEIADGVGSVMKVLRGDVALGAKRKDLKSVQKAG